MEKLSSSLLRTIRKIPFFTGLPAAELAVLLKLCRQTSYDAGAMLCRAAEPSQELFILLTGGVEVLAGDGVAIARVRPVTTIGEMGFITRRPRSAGVKAYATSTVLRIEKEGWDEVLEQHPMARLRLYENLIGLLSDKIVAGNLAAHDLTIHQERYEGRIQELERTQEAAVKAIAERCQVDEDEARKLLEEHAVRVRVSA